MNTTFQSTDVLGLVDNLRDFMFALITVMMSVKGVAEKCSEAVIVTSHG